MSSFSLLEEAQQQVNDTQQTLTEMQVHLRDQTQRMEEQYKKAEGPEKMTLHTLLQYTKKRQLELLLLHPSPFFVRCDTHQEQKESIIFIGKFSFPEKSIVSWVSPISTIRFAHLGAALYTLPDRSKKTVLLKRKDEYMIKEGKILFFATETLEKPRTLIHQENFSNRKTGFILPEIVARMEEAQDKVIRSSWKGPLVISGPAGSGKTTLALHRVAYLMQVPEISDYFPGHKIRVFVQDEGTKAYFSSLLPDLGIKNVEITTFAEWAKDVLEISFQNDTEIHDELIEDRLTIQKIRILRSPLPEYNKNAFEYLWSIYSSSLSEHKKVALEKLENKIVDDLDLTILLCAYKKTFGHLNETKDYFVQQRHSFEVKRKSGKFKVAYNLCIIDEFQNYLPEQLQLIRGCVNEETQSIVYVGDMQQQTKFGTIRSWKSVGEKINDERVITLEKVYRNTKNILRYIQSLGYKISIPEILPEGEAVHVLEETTETGSYISSYVKKESDRLIGILAKNKSDLQPYKKLENKTTKILTVKEAQGVEFETVFLVGNHKDTWNVKKGAYTPEEQEEKEKINSDLLYVALTRAMSELYVVNGSRVHFN